MMSTDQTGVHSLQQAVDRLSTSQKLQLIEFVARSLQGENRPYVGDDQRAALGRLRRAMKSLPTCDAAENFSNRQHDRLLYGESA